MPSKQKGAPNASSTKKKQTTKPIVLPTEANEPDSTYLLKLVLYVLLGTFWIKLAQPVEWLGLPLGAIPVGLLLGLLFVKWFEKYQTDRKIWYAILIVVTILGYFVPAGIVI